MSMKDIAYILASMAVLLLTACGGGSSDDDESTIDGHSYQQSETLPATDADEIIIISSLTTEINKVTGGAKWLTVLIEDYTSGSPSLRLIATDNVSDGKTTQVRSCSLTISSLSGDKTILSVTQEGIEMKTGIDDSHDIETDQPAYSRHK